MALGRNKKTKSVILRKLSWSLLIPSTLKQTLKKQKDTSNTDTQHSDAQSHTVPPAQFGLKDITIRTLESVQVKYFLSHKKFLFKVSMQLT